MALIKSYGNYVIRQKHQTTNNGTIFERDYATIGGISEGFDDNLHSQGTFVFEVNNENTVTKIYNTNEWFQNKDGNIWTQEELSKLPSFDNSLKIILKQDNFRLKDFAYYGSCVELIRSSIIDIMNRFPGELYFLEGNVLTYENQIGELEDVKLSGSTLYLIDNPFNLDIHTPSEILNITEQEELRFILPHYDKYILIDNSGTTYSITNIVVEKYGKNTLEDCKADFFARIEISCSSNLDVEIYAYKDENGTIFYLAKENFQQFHIRPKEEYFQSFLSSLDSFQKIILNPDSKPQYSTIFEVMEETDYGYQTFYKKFIFPLAMGDYNLDIMSENYTNYINSLSKYASLYDEIYCNNIYNHMTHESIKNFDWTNILKGREISQKEYDENGQKILKLLSLCGRELDEIKFYIDGIKNTNIITYNDANNIPDYFLTDTLNIEGWDVKNVYPFKKQNNEIIEDISLQCKPYANQTFCNNYNTIDFPNGYFCGYFSSIETCEENKIQVNENDENYKIDNQHILRERIKQYINDKNYSMQDVNNKFMKYLKLNSRAILQKKGTIEAIESMLGLFGMKSKRWFESLESTQQRLLKDINITYDYDIKEHVAITSPLNEMNSMANDEFLPKSTNLYDFFNSTKTLTYYNTNELSDNAYVPYQGLPVRYYELENQQRVLYPYFSSNKVFDGNFYYQMKGGWLNKEYYFDAVSATTQTNKSFFTDTNTQIPSVNSLQELLNLDENILYDGIVYYVQNIKGLYICINDEIYDVKTNESGRYFEVPVINGSITLGNQIWYGEIEIYNNQPNKDSNIYEEGYHTSLVNLYDYKNGELLKLIIKSNNTVFVKQDEQLLINYTIFKDGRMFTSYNNELDEPPTNYFILENKQWKSMLGFWGWKQLKITDQQYLNIKKLLRNYKGNNPHTNLFQYDNGLEYIKYFEQLFRYAIKNEEFNQNCYSSFKEYVISLNYMKNNVGFSNLINRDACQEKINLYDDTKIHHFCDYLTSDGLQYNFYEFNDKTYDSNYYNFYEKPEYSQLMGDAILSGAVTNKQTCLDQIINLKNVTLTIFKSVNNSDATSIENNTLQWKYFDEIILHYLSQILPSNVILKIELKEKEIT